MKERARQTNNRLKRHQISRLAQILKDISYFVYKDKPRVVLNSISIVGAIPESPVQTFRLYITEKKGARHLNDRLIRHSISRLAQILKNRSELPRGVQYIIRLKRHKTSRTLFKRFIVYKFSIFNLQFFTLRVIPRRGTINDTILQFSIFSK